MISPSSTDPAVTQTGNYIFRACFVDTFQGEVMASFAVNTLKAKKAAILTDFNSPYSKGLTDYFKLSFGRLGGMIVSEQTYTQGDADFKGQLSTIRSAEPDVIYIPGYYGDVALIAKQARLIGLTQPLLGGDGWDAPELWQLGGDALNGAYISTHYSVDDPSPAIQQFVALYKQRYGNLRVRPAVVLGLASLGGVGVGALIATSLPEHVLRKLFGLLMLGVAAQLAWRAYSSRR